MFKSFETITLTLHAEYQALFSIVFRGVLTVSFKNVDVIQSFKKLFSKT